MNASLFRSLLLALVLAAPAAQAQDPIVRLERAFTDLKFELPLGIRFADDGRDEMYVAEYGGRVKVVPNDPAADTATVFLDLSERIATAPPGEFFAIEFHPDYAENGTFFVRYKLQNPERTVLSRFQRSASNPLEADPESEVVLLEIETPGNANNHHGGDLAFGPDGYLYVALGDGGTQFDQAGNAQDRTKLLGKVLRLDVDNPAGGLNYGLPPDNPFVGNEEGWREEVWATGLRNPWRMTIDRETGEVWLGDVGENDWEEVNRIEAGANYGWPIMEGPECAPFGPATCEQEGLILPVWAYPREVGGSITGGYVYRGDSIPELYGHYIFADFNTKDVWSVDIENPETARRLVRELWDNVTTFGEGPDGELYLSAFFSGRVYRLLPPPPTDAEGGPAAVALRLDVYPNPIRSGATVAFGVGASGPARLALFDVLGREVGVLFDGVVVGDGERVRLGTRGLAPGLYVLRLEAGGTTGTRKVIVTR